MLNKKIIAFSILSIYLCNSISPNLIFAKTIKLDEMEMSIPNNLPSFNESISNKYQSALNALREEGFESNIKTEINNNISNSNIKNENNLFLEKFPSYNATLNQDIVLDKMGEMQNSFNEIYENSNTEKLPSKEATLIWDKEEILNSASKPQGYDEALKKTTAKLEGGVSEDFKNKVEGNINSIFSYLEIHQNDKPTTPEAPTVGKVETPDMLYADKPDFPAVPEGVKPEKPTLAKPTGFKIDFPNFIDKLLPIIPKPNTPSSTPSTVPETQTNLVPNTVPQANTNPSTNTATNPVTNPSKKPSTSPSTSPSNKPISKPTVEQPSNSGVTAPSNKNQKDETQSNKGNSWGDSILKGGLITAGIFVALKGGKIALGALSGGLPGAVLGAFA